MSLMYTAMPLDRCTNQRNNKHWLDQQFKAENARFCLVKAGENLLTNTEPLTPVYLTLAQLPNISINSCIFLGRDNNRSLFALDCNKISRDEQQSIDKIGHWQSLRNIGAILDREDAGILSLAKALVHWHKTHLYCGKCGALNQLLEAGHARRCTHSECRNMTFPRTDPAVIMLVERIDKDGVARCLLGRQDSWPQGVYSTLAGFVDPGESLEQAVIREVAEESGIQVTQPSYIASQPWPFPASIMLGFTATAVTTEIDISKDDLQDAQWFSREQLALFSARESDLKTQYKMSSADSISSYLITAWLNQEIGKF